MRLLLVAIGVLALVLGLASMAGAAGPGETGSGVIPPGFTKVTFVHHAGGPPQVLVEQGPDGKGRPLSGEANVCSDPATNGTAQCDSFQWDGQYWPGAAVTYNVNLNNSGDDGGFLGAIQASAQTWEDDSGSSFDFTFGGPTVRKASSLRNKMDGNNDVTWDALKKYQDPIAVTIFWYFTSTGELVEADLVNNESYPWSSNDGFDGDPDDTLPGDPTAFDLQDIETHEFGHFLVLRDLYNDSDSALTMFGFGTLGQLKSRTLGLGDQLGIRAIYGGPQGNRAPVADAGPDQNVATGASVQLDGSESSDPDGDSLTYGWAFVSRPDGSAATLSGASTATPTFVADVDGTYEVDLTVSDGELSDSDRVVIAATSGVGSATDIYVWSIELAEKKRGRRTDLIVTVVIRRDSNANGVADQSDAVVQGAVVDGVLWRNSPDFRDWDLVDTTDDQGEASWKLRDALNTTYFSRVESVTRSGDDYNALLNRETEDSHAIGG